MASRAYALRTKSLFFIALAVSLTGVFSALGQDAYTAAVEPPILAGTSEATALADEYAPLPIPEGSHENGYQPAIELNTGNDRVSPIPHKVHYGLRLTIRGVYDDNVNLTPVNETGDYYFAIEPGFTIGVGDVSARQENYIQLDYAPSLFLFVDNSDNNALQHVFHLSGLHRFSHLTLSMSQDIQILAGANLNTTASTGPGGTTALLDNQAGVDIYNTLLNASYDLTGKTFLSGGLQYNVTDYQDNLIDSEVLSGNLFINYTYSPKLVVGLGVTGGYNWVESPNPSQTFEQINARVSYQATGKISLNASGGVEFRQFEGDSQGGHTSPVYEIDATYQPFDGTNISLTGSRGTQNSASIANQDYANTTIFFGIRQRLLRRLNLALAGGYQNSEYFSTVSGLNATRNDDYFFIQPAIDVMITRYWTMGVYYLHRENDSSAESSSFNNNQFGIRTALTF